MAFTASPSHFKIRDFLVDFFGCLIPGFIFTFLIALTFGWAMLSLYVSLLPKELQSSQIFPGNVLENIQLVILVFTLAVSYVVGHILFRLDPKLPDERSVWRQRKAIYLKNEQDGAVRVSGGNRKYDPGFLTDLWRTLFGLGFKEKAENVPDVQFPYLFLYVNFRTFQAAYFSVL
jgi:hypothetical protein